MNIICLFWTSWKDKNERKFEGSDCNLVVKGLVLKFTFFFELLRGGIDYSLLDIVDGVC